MAGLPSLFVVAMAARTTAVPRFNGVECPATAHAELLSWPEARGLLMSHGGAVLSPKVARTAHVNLPPSGLPLQPRQSRLPGQAPGWADPPTPNALHLRDVPA